MAIKTIKTLLAELDAIDKEIQDITAEYQGKLEELGKIYDAKLDEASKRFNDKEAQLRDEIAKS